MLIFGVGHNFFIIVNHDEAEDDVVEVLKVAMYVFNDKLWQGGISIIKLV